MKKELKAMALLPYLALYIGWGTTYLAIRIGMESMGPATFLALRFLIAAILFLPPVMNYYRKNKFIMTDVLNSGLQGIGLLVMGLYPIAISEEHVPSNVVALIIASAPLGFAFFDNILNQKSFTLRQLLSVLFGLSGVFVLNMNGGAISDAPPTALGLIFFGIMAWCFSSIYFKKKVQTVPIYVNIFFQYLMASLILGTLATTFEKVELSILTNSTLRSIIALVYIILIPSILSYASYIWLLKNEPSERVSTYAYINPLVAILTGWVFLNEAVTLNMISALCLILISTFLIFHKNPMKKEIE